MSETQNIHGTGLVLGKTGVLLRGPSGAGKSVLALTLLDRWETRGEAAYLVADDRVDLKDDGTRLTMIAPPRLEGLIELRGRGIVRRPHQQTARLDLVIDLVPDLMRLVEEEDLQTELMGHLLARAPVPHAGLIPLAHQELLVVEAVRATIQAAGA